MISPPAEYDISADDHVDDEIIDCLRIEQPRSFFLFAGAGSGKTRSLVTALKQIRAASGNRMRLHGQQVAVITYTNAACDEIKRRLDFDPLINVSTIHSFIWGLVKGFNQDIRLWLQQNLALEIIALQEEQRRGRAGTKTAATRELSILSKQRRLGTLSAIDVFVYSPTGDNRSRDSLNHSEVIKIGADFLSRKPLMQKLLIGRFPILLVDESQDTNKLLMEAFLVVQATHSNRFALGLFGDTMQRIYSDGKVDLGKNVPNDWAKPALLMNHRCPRRVVRLINQIRSEVDEHQQRFRADAVQGHVRLFISESGRTDKSQIEEKARRRMAEITADGQWDQPEQVKTLTLEHHMAARRMNFFEMFEPLHQIEGFRTGLLDGSLPVVRFFSDLVLPLVQAESVGDKFAAAAIVRKESPLLSKKTLESIGGNQLSQLKAARDAVAALMSVCRPDARPSFRDVLQCICDKNLFDLPDGLQPFAIKSGDEVAEEVDDTNSSEEATADAIESVHRFLDAPFSQIETYTSYVKETAGFDTHQGVKGLQFARVLVIMDDEEARGFLFSYEKLFGAKAKTRTDVENETTGSETGNDRTRRLFYVTCSRSEQSLAVVAYSSNPAKVREHAISQGWFDESETELLI